MSFGTIATWRMAHDGIVAAMEQLKSGASSGDALETTVKSVEDYPYYKSVGFGGLPNAKGILEMDAAFMDGDTFQIGAVAGIVDIKNPISVARKLSHEKFNSFLISDGATQYAIEHGFEEKEMFNGSRKENLAKSLR